MKHVPEYLLPQDGNKGLTADEVGFVPLRRSSKLRGQRKGKGARRGGFRGGARKGDPLKTFKARRKAR